jgi:hypothetical protein
MFVDENWDETKAGEKLGSMEMREEKTTPNLMFLLEKLGRFLFTQ